MDMEQMNELELLKQLPISKRVDILEERVLDLEKLIEKYNEFIKYSSLQLFEQINIA